MELTGEPTANAVRDEIVLLESEISKLIDTDPHWFQSPTDPPARALANAVQENDLSLLRAYHRGLVAGIGMNAAYWIHPELKARGFDNIEDYIVPWRYDLRMKTMYGAKEHPNYAGTMDDYDRLTECLVRMYTADTESGAQLIADIIVERGVIDPEELTKVRTLLQAHPKPLANGVL